MGIALKQAIGLGTHLRVLAALAMSLAVCGCASISERTQAYLGTPSYAPVNPSLVQVLSVEPSRPFVRLGEIMLSVDGNPSREQLEARLRASAAALGASAVYIASDQTHVFPAAYWDYWGPPAAAYWQRIIVGIAIRYK